MTQQAAAPGAKSTLPPIPKMDASTPATSTAGDLRSTLREIQQEVKKAVADEKQSKADARRAATDAKKAQTDANAQAKQAVVQLKQAQDQSGVIASTAPPPALPDDIPPQVMNVISMTFTFVAVLALGVPLVRVFARRLDRKTQSLQMTGPDFAPALRTLQESVDAMAIEVERISEGQRFTSKLLAERAALAAGSTPDRQPVS